MSHRIHVIENFITPEDAAIMMQEQDRPSEVNPYPPYYADRFGGTAFPYNKRILDLQIKYGEMSNEVHKEVNGFLNPIYVFKSFGSVWNPGSMGGLHEDAQDPEPFIEWSTIIYLNDEYEGGTIYFPNQGVEISPNKYSAVFFPSAGSEYIHGVSKVTSGTRRTCLYMHTSKPGHADPDFIGGRVLTNANDWEAHRHPHAIEQAESGEPGYGN